MHRKSILAILLATSWADVAAAQAGFDCPSARSPAETAICPQARLSSSAGSRETVQGGCHMDICTWFRVDHRDTVRTNRLGSLLRIAIAIGELHHPNASYSSKTPIEWGLSETAYVFCSKAQPAIIFGNDARWEAATLSPGHSEGVFGYNELAYAEYLFVCHGLANANPADPSIAARFGYPPSLVRKIDQFELERPGDIMRLR